MLGIELDADAWLADDDELATLLFPIMALTLPDELLQEQIKTLQLHKTIDEVRQAGIELSGHLANAIYEYWLERRQDLYSESDTLQQTAFKIGRNEPCPCSSGKKYKKCCLDEVLH